MIPSKPSPGGQGQGSRPTDKELGNKIREALELVKAGKWLPAEPAKLKANFDELETKFGIETTLQEDQTKILVESLQEVSPDNYAGSRPPMKSYERRTKDLEMFAFAWKSSFFGAEMYQKFSIGGKDQNRRVFFYSIHEDWD